MKESVRHPFYGDIVYNESFWTGKKTLMVDGVDAQQISKKEYIINGKTAYLKGNYLIGVKLDIEGEVVQVSPKTKWYEMVLAILPFLFLIIWGNSAALCAIFPVVGGALGGALGGIAIVVSLVFVKKRRAPLAKILIGAAVAAVTVFVAFMLALAIIHLVA